MKSQVIIPTDGDNKAPSQPECGGIPDNTVNSLQRAVREFQRHECLGRERTGQVAGLLGRKAKSRIVIPVSEDDDDAFTPIAEFGKPAANELAADLAALMAWQDGQRR